MMTKMKTEMMGPISTELDKVIGTNQGHTHNVCSCN